MPRFVRTKTDALRLLNGSPKTRPEPQPELPPGLFRNRREEVAEAIAAPCACTVESGDVYVGTDRHGFEAYEPGDIEIVCPGYRWAADRARAPEAFRYRDRLAQREPASASQSRGLPPPSL